MEDATVDRKKVLAQDPEIQVTEDRGLESRTTGAAGQSCRRCGAPIKGRRRNGFCSDKCRMKDRRERNAQRRRQTVEQMKQFFTELERELLGKGHES